MIAQKMRSNARPMGFLRPVWERELEYECRSLFPAGSSLIAGDKSGRVRCLSLDGSDRWNAPVDLEKPIYAIAFIHPEELVALGTAGGGVHFRAYASGEAVEIDHAVKKDAVVSAMLFDRSDRELWIGSPDGTLHRMRDRRTIDLREPISALVFTANGARIAAATTEGSIIELDPKSCEPVRRSLPQLGPIRAAASFSRGSCEILALASGTGLHCAVRLDGGEPRLDTAHFRGRISCLSFFERDGDVWLAAGTSDGTLTCFRMPGPEVSASSFAGGSFSLKQSGRILRLASIGATLFAALDNNEVRAFAPESDSSPLDLEERANQEDARAFRFRIYRLLEEAKPDFRYELLGALTRIRAKTPAARATVGSLIRHTDKYGVGGPSFSDKRHHLGRMARFDTRSGGEYLLDALLYRCLLEERRYEGQGTLALGAPITGLVRFEHRGTGQLLVESYGEDGRAWLVADPPDQRPVSIAFDGESTRIGWLQHARSFRDRVLLFCRERGATSASFDELCFAPARIRPPEFVENAPRPLYVYASAMIDEHTLITGGRFRDLHFLEVGSEGALSYKRHESLSGEDRYAPVRAIIQRGDELFAGCDDGSFFRFELSSNRVQRIFESSASLRHALALQDVLVLSDSNGTVTFLAPSRRRASRFDAVWSIRFGAAITAMIAATPRLVLAADASGLLHAIDPVKREHLYSVRLEGGEERAVRQLVLLPPGARDDGVSVAAGCFDHALRRMAIASPELRAKERTKSVARAARSPSVFRALRKGSWFEEVREKDRLLELAAALSSVAVDSPAPSILSLWTKYPSPASLEDLIRDIRAIARSGGRVQDRDHTHLSISERVRLMFKACADRLETAPADDESLKATLARVVQTCHDLMRGWGLESSSENRRIRRTIARFFFASATEKMLEVFLSDALARPIGRLRARSMRDLLRDHLLRHTDQAVVGRTIASIAHAVEHDRHRKLTAPMREHVLPLLVEELAELIVRAPSVAEAAHRAIRELFTSYELDESLLLALLFHASPTARVFFFLADREEVLRDPTSPVPEEMRDLAELAFPDERGAEARARTLKAIEKRAKGSLYEDQSAAVASFAALMRVVAAFDVPIAGVALSPPEGLAEALATLKDDRDAAARLRIDPLGLARLVRCAELTIEAQLARANLRSTETIITVCENLRDASDELMRAQSGSNPRSPALIDALFELAFLHVQRRVRAELDLFAPMSFLPGQLETEPFALLEDYVRLHHRLTRSEASVVLRRSDRPGSIALLMLPQELELTLDASLVRETLTELLPVSAVKSSLIELAEDIVAEVPTTPGMTRPDLAPGGDDLITLAFDGRLAGALFFQYQASAGPDPAQRALARTLPQVLIADALRTQETHRQMAQIFHHISEPAQAMRWRLQTLTTTDLPPEVVREYYRDLSVHVEESLFMLNNYHSFVRVRRGEDPPLSVQNFDLIEQVEFRRRLVGEKFKFQRKTIRPDYQSQSLFVRLDPLLVGDIVQNLLDNACKYSFDGQEVVLRVGASKNEVFVSVNDKGIGVPPDMEHALFTFGTRGADPRVKHQQGLGIGLYMADTYARWMRGRIEYKRRKDETRFVVILPVSLEEDVVEGSEA